MKRTRVPTMIEYLDTEWDEGDGLPGPAYRRRYGVEPGGPEAMGETQGQWDARMKRNDSRYRAEMRRRHSKRTRVRQFVERLTGWHDPYPDLRNQPFIVMDYEISVEEARAMFGFEAHPDAIGVIVGHTVYAPIEVEVDPWPRRST